MDTSRKCISDKETCHYCINYQPLIKGLTKYSRGKCRVTGTYKQRTEKCKKCFISKEQLSIMGR